MRNCVLFGSPSTGFVIVHALDGEELLEVAEQQINCHYQWFVTDDPNVDGVAIAEETGEGMTVSFDDIRGRLNGKWVYCRVEKPDETYNSYNSECVYLTDEFVSLLKRNRFDDVGFLGEDGKVCLGNHYAHSPWHVYQKKESIA